MHTCTCGSQRTTLYIVPLAPSTLTWVWLLTNQELGSWLGWLLKDQSASPEDASGSASLAWGL